MKLRFVKKPDDLFSDLAMVRHQCKIDDDLTYEDDYLRLVVGAVVGLAETELNRPLLPQRWEKTIDLPASELILKSDVRSVSEAVFVLDDGSELSIPASLYRLVLCRRVALLNSPPSNAVAIRVVFDCGAFDSVADVPNTILQWVLLNVGTLYCNREAVVTGAVVNQLPRAITDGLLDEWRVY